MSIYYPKKALLMNIIPADFIKALKDKNNTLLNNALKFMTYEYLWVNKDLYEQTHIDTICVESWNQEAEYSYWTERVTITDWTPLAEAAYNLNEDAIKALLLRWPDKTSDLVERTYAALAQASAGVAQYNPQLNTKILYPMDLKTIEQATILIRHHMALINPKFKYTYDKINNDAYFNYLITKISRLNSTDELIKFYDTYIEQHVISYKKCAFSLFYAPIYSDKTIELITCIHEHIHQLLKKQNEQTISTQCRDLLCSNIFALTHYEKGVTTYPIRRLIQELWLADKSLITEQNKLREQAVAQQTVNEPDNSAQIFSIPKYAHNPIPVAVAITGDEHALEASYQPSLMSQLVNSLHDSFESILKFLNAFVSLIKHAISIMNNYFHPNESNKIEQNDLYIFYNRL